MRELKRDDVQKVSGGYMALSYIIASMYRDVSSREINMFFSSRGDSATKVTKGGIRN